jgi:hypothetical protein
VSGDQEHTPGPWFAINRGTGWEIHHFSDATRPGCWCGTADCHGKLPEGMRTDFDREADARLAAAAPDLLDACIVAHAAIMYMDPELLTQAQAPLLAAIEKATTPALSASAVPHKSEEPKK